MCLRPSRGTMRRVLAKDLASNVLKLPRLPIPPLEKTADRYRASIVPLKPADTVKAHLQKLDMFVSSSGKELQKALVDADKAAEAKGGYPYSYIEPIWDAMYLNNRAPLPVNTNPGILAKNIKHAGDTQAGVAAAVVYNIAKWIQRVIKEGLEVGELKQDVSPVLRQFGASLIPGESKDEFLTTPPEKLRHVIILHDGHLYALRVFDEQQVPIERAVIQRSIEYILSVTPDLDNTTPVSVLTAGGRQTWAHAYAELVKTPENAEILKKVQEGILVVCLDTRKWGDDDKLKNAAMLHGDKEEAENRWYDKHQIIISADGQFAFNFEHAGSDGVQWVRWVSDVLGELEGANASAATATATATAASIDAKEVTSLVEPLRVTFGKAFATHIRSARAEVQELIGRTALEALHLPFGKKQLKLAGVSPDAFVQMCFHVAFHKCRNKLAPTYEAASTSQFFHGRTETIRSATQEMLALAEAVNKGARDVNAAAALNETERAGLVGLAKAASERHVTLANAAVNGEGVDRHLTALRQLALDCKDGAALNFFEDDVYKTCTRWLLSTSNVSNAWINRFAFGPVTPNGYGLGYVIDENEVRIMLSAFTSSPSTNVGDLKAALECAAMSLFHLLDGAKK
ncbi:putative carnitine/choline acetyltransferase [Trypanosoma theileri]|uniref:Putative carnitine/choline acetyltransferase n=1 Tax=Trypanosoma theileri TaxID=67003 RepID=A0A1X0NZS6_9TRYP|nr:putative carnitine/choline acetyltransferase [Trypanosoma theileri]ORC90196.1 putative carnitine/choline acetyltransferase [Trypanosoma theileri]